MMVDASRVIDGSGGGASHGDFEVGAVRRLFQAGVEPMLIVSTSVRNDSGECQARECLRSDLMRMVVHRVLAIRSARPVSPRRRDVVSPRT